MAASLIALSAGDSEVPRQHVPLKLQANNGEICILLHVTKYLFILQNPNFSLGDLRRSLPEDKKKKYKWSKKSPAQDLQLLLPQISKWENGMHSPAYQQPFKSLPFKQISQQMFNRKWSKLFSLHTYNFSGIAGRRLLVPFLWSAVDFINDSHLVPMRYFHMTNESIFGGIRGFG